MMRGIAAALWAASWVAACSAQVAGTSAAICASCHAETRKVADSAHAATGCLNCHAGRERYPHPAGARTLGCAECHAREGGQHGAGVHGLAARRGNSAAPACSGCHGRAHEVGPARSEAYRKAVPATCGRCHTEIARQYRSSVHGAALARGVVPAAVCTDCHGEHSIQQPSRPASLVNRGHIAETCGQCHGNVRLARKFGFPADRLVSYEASFHGLAARAGSQTVANCASCHGVHNILPSSDVKSTVHARNLPATCGHCHDKAGARFALGPVHLWPGRTDPGPVRWIRTAYLVLIPVLIGLMFLHNAGDWVRKCWRLRTGMVPGESRLDAGIRMLRLERIEHGCLVASFLVLAWTGFLLKYPDQWWVRPFAWFGEAARGTVHRGAAAVFIAVGVIHLASLISSARLRAHWKELWPRRGDFVQAVRRFGYNLGLTSERPALGRFSYIEKLEYCGLVWGFALMTGTGVLLWANNLVLARVGKALLDAAITLHFYQAILTCLAVVVWHFYHVVFDPDVYPMNPCWIQGSHEPSEEEAERAGAGEQAAVGEW